MPDVRKIVVEGIDITSLTRFSLGQGQTFRAMPAKRTNDLVIPGAHGVIPVFGDTFEPGELPLRFVVWNTDESGSVIAGKDRWGTYDENIDTLFALFGTTNRLLDVRMTMGDGSIRQAWCRVADQMMPDPVGMEQNVGVFNTILEIPGSFWQDVDPQSWITTPVNSVQYTVPTLTGSSAPIEDAILGVIGPTNTPVRITHAYTGGWVQLDAAIPSGQQWIVDCGKWETTLNGVNCIDKVTYGNSGPRFMRLVPQLDSGQRVIKIAVVATGLNATSKLSVNARRKFI